MKTGDAGDETKAMCWPLFAGGVSGLVITLIPQIGGGARGYDALGHVEAAIPDPAAAAGLAISWHSTTIALLLVSSGMLYTAFAPTSRDVARACGVAGAVFFCAISVLFMLQGAERFGNPFALWPFVIVLVPALCGAIGAWQVSRV